MTPIDVISCYRVLIFIISVLTDSQFRYTETTELTCENKLPTGTHDDDQCMSYTLSLIYHVSQHVNHLSC